jgi:predicted O-methyltransferase YrrM
VSSREAAGTLTRPGGLVRGPRGRPAAERALVALFGAIGWPWLLRSLCGGPRRERSELCAVLGLPPGAVPSLGSWRADVGFLRFLADHILATGPQLVVEFGAGVSSLVAARALQMRGAGRLLSFDHHAEFLPAVRDRLAELGLEAELRHAPLTRRVAGWPGLWYEHGEVAERIDLLIIDGPPWTTHPFGRGAADSLFARIPPGGSVLLDDASRPGERGVGRRWRRRWPAFEFRLLRPGGKGTLVGTQRGR